jgi:stage III sporulation protein AE
MRKIAFSFMVFLFLFFAFCKPVYAVDIEADAADAWEKYGMGEVAEGLDHLIPDYDLDMWEIWGKILQGKITEAAMLLWEGIKGKLLSELAGMKNIFASILILGIISALFANFSDVFQNHQIADISFYFLYLLLMSILMKAFLTAADIAGQTVENIVLFIKMFIPTYFMAVGAATGAATGAVYYQFTLVLAYGVEKIIFSLLIPLIYSYVLLALLNGIWAEERLALLLDFLKKGIGAGLKVAMGAITSLSLFQSMIAPVLDSLKVSAVKKAVGAIPGIGNLAEGVTEMVIGSAVLIKNSIGVLMLLLLLAICLIPLAKLFLIACMMKGSAALVGIVSDKRITGCTDRVGDGSLLLFKAAFTAVALFMITIAVVAYTTGKGI